MKISCLILAILLLITSTAYPLERLQKMMSDKPALVSLAGFAVTARKIIGDEPLSSVVRDTPTLTKLAGAGALCYAAYQGMKSLLANQLVWAANKRNLQAVKWYLAFGADPNRGITRRRTREGALWWIEDVAYPTYYPLIEACKTKHRDEQNVIGNDIAALLIAHGADVDNAGSYYGGSAPLMQACKSGNIPLVTLLIAHGADVNYTEQDTQTTPLSETMNVFLPTRNPDDQQIFDLLIAHGADVHKPITYHITEGSKDEGTHRNASLLRQIVRYRNNIFDYLKKHGGLAAIDHMIDSILKKYDWESLERVCKKEKLDFNELSQRLMRVNPHLKFELMIPLIMNVKAVDSRATDHENHHLCLADCSLGKHHNPSHTLYDKNIMREVMGYL